MLRLVPGFVSIVCAKVAHGPSLRPQQTCLRDSVANLAKLRCACRYGHLCDGVVHLVLVRRCSRWQYLRFLLTMSNSGLEAGKMGGYIEVMPAVAVKVEPVSVEGVLGA